MSGLKKLLFVWTHRYSWVIDNNSLKYQNPTQKLKVTARTGIIAVCAVKSVSITLVWVKVMNYPWVMSNNCVKNYSNPT